MEEHTHQETQQELQVAMVAVVRAVVVTDKELLVRLILVEVAVVVIQVGQRVQAVPVS